LYPSTFVQIFDQAALGESQNLKPELETQSQASNFPDEGQSRRDYQIENSNESGAQDRSDVNKDPEFPFPSLLELRGRDIESEV
jgi:hypothetical protein